MTAQKNLEVKGTVLNHPLAELLAEISQSELTGSLRLSHLERKIIIYFDGGDAVFAVSNSRRHRLFHILLREEKIIPSQLSAIPNVANDMELKVTLVQRETFTESEMKKFFAVQVGQILEDALGWDEGNWVFSPLVRINDDIRVTVDLPDLLFPYGRKMPVDKQVRRFKSLQEKFGVRKSLPAHISLLPQEAFVFSRFDGAVHSVGEIKNLTGLSEAETFRTLYILWLGGFLVRQRWNSGFSPENLAAILSARIELKKQAVTPAPVREKAAAEKPSAGDRQTKNAAEKLKDGISLEEYLQRVGNAATYYEILDVSSEADTADIKSAYFGLAKRFHPDLFYRRVEDELHRRIQSAFTKLAQAYETLRKPESREVYDFKLQKEIANLSKRAKSAASGSQTPAEMMEEQAAENFEVGFNLLMEEEYEEAVPYLARAVHLTGGNARYRAYFGKALSANENTYRQAEAEFQAALRIEPDNLDYRLMLAELFVKIGFVKRAEAEIGRILEKSPRNYEALSLLDSLRDK